MMMRNIITKDTTLYVTCKVVNLIDVLIVRYWFKQSFTS